MANKRPAKATPPSSPTDSLSVVSGLAQELDAPLTSLLISSRKLLEEYKDRDFEYISYKDFKALLNTLSQMNRQIERCSLTTKKVLDLSRARGVAQSCDLNQVVRDIAGMLNQQFSEHKVSCRLKLEPQLPMVALGVIECHQVVHNIVLNALQAMPGGGVIHINTKADASGVHLSVSDNGVGISPEYLQKVFDPFFTLRERGVGAEKHAGLGLSIVRSIIMHAGGNVELKSSLRRGTEVLITLPKAA